MKTKLLLCFLTLGMLTATAQFQIKQEPTPWDKLIPNNIKITEKVVNNKPAAAQPARAEQATHQVNFMLDFDAESQDAYSIVLVNQDGMLTNQNIGIRKLQYGSNNASVPEGTYDIVTIFDEYQNKGTAAQARHHGLFVIHEHVTIDQDMQLDFSADEAKNHIQFQMLNNDGEPIACPSYSRSEDWQMTMIEQGNTQLASYQKKVFCKDYGEVIRAHVSVYLSTEQVGDYLIDYQSLPDFYVNDVSDRYAFGSYCVTIDWDWNIYTSYKEVQGASGDVTLANDPAKFKLYEYTTKEQEQDYYNEVEFQLHNNALDWAYRYGINLNYTPLEKAETIKFYIGASADESKVGYVPYIQPQIYKKVIAVDGDYEWEDCMPFFYSTPITHTNESIVFANSGLGNYCANYWPNDLWSLRPEWDENEQAVELHPSWPSHPAFTYPIDKKKGEWGNSCPILITNPMQYIDAYYNYVENSVQYQYLGRYGEISDDHRNNAWVNMTLNGGAIYEGLGFNLYDNLSHSYNFFRELFNGVVDATITNEAIKVDDLDGSNNAQLHYTAGAEDETPPTMTMLHFKDNNGDVTDRFATAEDGTVEFSAADFNFFYTPDGDCSYFRYAPQVVQVEYAPYGTEDWNELPVEELPEYYYPVMGWFYRGSLAGVTGQAEKGWFDLKFRLTDAAGNWQEQVVSPAFRIDDLAYSSVATVGSGNAREVARYSLDGQRVDANHQGVTIVKMSDGSARKVLVK